MSQAESQENDNIYIDCNPVDIHNEVIETDAENNEVPSNTISTDITRNVLGGSLTDNIGFQSILGIAIIGILYGIGNYIFKQYPTKLLQNKIDMYSD